MGWPAEHCLASERHIDTLTCAICLDILKEPVTGCILEHHFCRPCVAGVISRCPSCQQRFTGLRPATAVGRMVEDLQMRCEEPECDWTGDLYSWREHPEKCDWEKIRCHNRRCDHRHLRRDDRRHRETCPYERVDCPAGLTRCHRMERRDVPDHLNRCRHHRCPKYSRDGCRFTGTRRDVADHSVYCLRMHQQLVEQEAALARVERSLKRTRDAWDTEVRSVRRKLETLRDEHDQTLEALDDVVDDHQSLQDAHDQLAADFEREQRARMRAEFEADQLAMENAELQWTTESLERQVTDLLDDGRGGLVAPWRLIPADPYPDFAPMPDPTPSTDMDSGSDVESIRHTSGYGTPVSAYLEDDERSLPSSASSPPDWMTKYIGQDFSDEYPTPSSCGSSSGADASDDSAGPPSPLAGSPRHYQAYALNTWC